MYLQSEDVRLLSSILLGFMAMVLPMAGMQQYFCTTGMVFVEEAGDCPVKQSERDADCCGMEHKPESPDCMSVSKSIPDANLTEPFTVPSCELETSHAEVTGLSDERQPEEVTPGFGFSRGPPSSEPLFLMQQRWLI